MSETKHDNPMSYLQHEDGSCEMISQPQEVRSWRADMPAFAGGTGGISLPTGTLIVGVYTCGDAHITAIDMDTRKEYDDIIKAGVFLPVKLAFGAEAPKIGGSAVMMYIKPHIYKEGEYYGDFDKLKTEEELKECKTFSPFPLTEESIRKQILAGNL